MNNDKLKNYLKGTSLALAAALLFGSCGTSQGSTERKAEEAALQQQITDSMDARSFHVTFDYVEPIRMPSHYLTTAYDIRLKGDSLTSFLPYFGRAYKADYNADQSPLDFSGRVESLEIWQGKKRDYKVTMRIKNKQEYFVYNLDVFPNGHSTLQVSSSDREAISFTGDMVLNQKGAGK